MKLRHFAVLFILMFALFGCNGVPINFGAPSFPAQLCAEYDPATSFLLAQSTERGIPLNELYYGLLDGTQLGMVFEALDREKVKSFMVDLGEWYEKNYPVSYTTLISRMTDQEKAQALTGILSRRIGAYNSVLIISKYDDCLLRAGWNDAMTQLYLK